MTAEIDPCSRKVHLHRSETKIWLICVADNFWRPKFALQTQSDFFFGPKFDEKYHDHFVHREKKGPLWMRGPLYQEISLVQGWYSRG